MKYLRFFFIYNTITRIFTNVSTFQPDQLVWRLNTLYTNIQYHAPDRSNEKNE